MSALYRRCGCQSPDGKSYPTLPEQATDAHRGAACPSLVSNARHGSWGFSVSAGFHPGTGKRVQVKKMGFATKREAQAARAKVVTDASAGKLRTPEKTTVGAYFEEWIERARGRDNKPLRGSTMSNYRRYVAKEIVPALGALRLVDVRRRHVQEFIDRLERDGRGATTIRRIHAVLSGAFPSAVKRDLIADNPAHNVDLPNVERERIRPWSPKQVGDFIEVAYGHRLGAMFETVLLTGLRRGEVIGLHWSDVDIAGRAITVRTNRTMAGLVVVENPTKTEDGQRTVPIPARLAESLIAWRSVQELEQADAGVAWNGTSYVFTYEDGSPLLPQYATRLFEKLRVKAGLPKVTFHGQRHEAIALMIAGGADLLTVSRIAGHSSVGITGDIYGHVFEAGKMRAAEGAAALLPPRVVTA
jgi:integrase